MAYPSEVSRWPGHPDPWTEDDLARMPRDGNRYEIIDGALVVTPPADFGHHEIADDILVALKLAAPTGWRPIREIGIRLTGGSLVVPDVTVFRPGAPRDGNLADPAYVDLVVEVESPSSRRHDRFTKPGLYAEAGIASYWRVERTGSGPVAHLYQRATAGHYDLHRSVGPAETFLVGEPFQVSVDPRAWGYGA